MNRSEMLQLLRRGIKPEVISYHKYLDLQKEIEKNTDLLSLDIFSGTCALCEMHRKNQCYECPLALAGQKCEDKSSIWNKLYHTIKAGYTSKSTTHILALRNLLRDLAIQEIKIGKITATMYPYSEDPTKCILHVSGVQHAFDLDKKLKNVNVFANSDYSKKSPFILSNIDGVLSVFHSDVREFSGTYNGRYGISLNSPMTYERANIIIKAIQDCVDRYDNIKLNLIKSNKDVVEAPKTVKITLRNTLSNDKELKQILFVNGLNSMFDQDIEYVRGFPKYIFNKDSKNVAVYLNTDDYLNCYCDGKVKYNPEYVQKFITDYLTPAINRERMLKAQTVHELSEWVGKERVIEL